MIDLVPVDPRYTYALDPEGKQWATFQVMGAGFLRECHLCHEQIDRGWTKDGHFYGANHFRMVPQHQTQQLFIITKAHNQDYVSAEAFLAPGTDKKETLIRVILGDTGRWFDAEPDPQDYDNGSASRYYIYDMEMYEEFKEQLAELRSMSIYEIEQHDRDDGNAWSIEEFEMPDLSDGSVHQICKLDTD